jgi:hypothetical protein
MYANAEPSRAEQVAALLTVRPTADTDDGGFGGGTLGSRGARRYREARIEPGETVTVHGQVLPFDQLSDPAGADRSGTGLAPAVADEEMAATLAAAREAGILRATPAEAWGNAAIPGFGVGRPVSVPALDAGVTEPELASPAEAERARRAFAIGPRDLVLAAAPDVAFVIALGPPGEAAARHRTTFVQGILGAGLAIGAALVLALVVAGAMGPLGP